MSREVPDLLVEQLALGELDEVEARRVKEQLEAADDPRLAAIEASNREILGDYPAQDMAQKIRRRLESQTEEPARGGLRWMWIPTAATVAAAVLILVLRPGAEGPAMVEPSLDGSDLAELRLPTGIEPTRLKGDPRLKIERRTGGGAESLRAGATVSEGDELQLSYIAGGAAHGVIVWIDGAGAVSLLYPSSASASTALSDRGPVALDHSYELNDAPEFERFLMVTAAEPIDVSRVMEAARTVAAGGQPKTEALALPEGFGVKSVVLGKE